MPLFEYVDEHGEEHKFVGPKADKEGREKIFDSVFGMSYSEAVRKLTEIEFKFDGHDCVMGLATRIVQLDAASAHSTMRDFQNALSQLTDAYGFKRCPDEDCGAMHNKKVRRCMRCGHEAEVPKEAIAKIKSFADSLKSGPEAQEAEPEEPEVEDTPEPAQTSALDMMGTDEDDS